MMQRLFSQIVDIIYTPQCEVCGNIGSYICIECFKKYVSTIGGFRCIVCNRECEMFTHYDCMENTYVDAFLPFLKYDGLVSKLITEAKYGKLSHMFEFLSKLLVNHLRSLVESFLNENNTLVTSVPMFRRKQCDRGFNQAEIIAKTIAHAFSLPYISLIHKSVDTSAQASKNKFQREELIFDHAYKLNYSAVKHISGSITHILIVDDVLTTGTTLNLCAKVIKENYKGIKVLGVVLATPR